MRNFSPNLVILVIVFILVGASVTIYYKQQNKSAAVINPQVTDSESSPLPALDASEEYSASDSSDAIQSPLPSPASLTQYIYPGAGVLTNSPSKIEMQSTEDPAKITDWYKDKIRELNFNAKSFSQINSNGVVFNKLSAAKPEEKIEVTIKKDQNASIVIITVDRP